MTEARPGPSKPLDRDSTWSQEASLGPTKERLDSLPDPIPSRFENWLLRDNLGTISTPSVSPAELLPVLVPVEAREWRLCRGLRVLQNPAPDHGP